MYFRTLLHRVCVRAFDTYSCSFIVGVTKRTKNKPKTNLTIETSISRKTSEFDFVFVLFFINKFYVLNYCGRTGSEKCKFSVRKQTKQHTHKIAKSQTECLQRDTVPSVSWPTRSHLHESKQFTKKNWFVCFFFLSRYFECVLRHPLCTDFIAVKETMNEF